MNELKLFKNEQFGEIRSLNIDGEPWFVARDISINLGYISIQKMYTHIDKEDKKNIDPQSEEYQGLCQNGVTLEPNENVRIMTIVNESGLYSAIFGSELSSAKKFKYWITHEVLPSIRKQGFYGRPTMELIQEMISELPEGSKRLIATSLSNSLLPMKKSTDVLYDFLDTKTSFIMLDPNKFPVVDYKIFTDYMITNGYNPDKIIRDLILEDMIKLSEFMQPIITQLINGKYISTIIFKIEASNKLYEE